ncbi:MAG: HAD family hydrolase [Candidatus Binataceae bacterium]
MTSAMYPKLWLFDFDTTLARLDPVVDWPKLRAGVRAILERADAPRKVLEQHPPRALAMYDAYRAHIERTPDTRGSRVLARVSKLIEKYELAGVDRARPLEGACELLRALARLDLRAAIVTSNSSVVAARWLMRHRVAATVSFIVGRDSKLALKPAPAMLQRALELSASRPRDTIYVGDSLDDLRAARRTRIRFVGVASDDAARDRLIAGGATEIYASPAALMIHMNLAKARPLGGTARARNRLESSPHRV